MVYMGSKDRIAKDLIPIITKYLTKDKWYVEPFCGGCNMIDKIKHPKRMANDKNVFLISMWKVFTEESYNFPQKIDKKLYSKYRDIFNKRGFCKSNNLIEDSLIGWIGFNGSCKGRFFDGGYCGEREDRDFVKEHINNISIQKIKLKGVKFSSCDYKDLIIPTNSIIYCDIPYSNTTQYSISKNFNHNNFWQWVREKTNEGCDVLVSEYNAPNDFVCVWQKTIINAVNNTSSLKPTEKLFVHKSIADKYLELTLF